MAASKQTVKSAETGRRVELARYRCDVGERVIVGQRIKASFGFTTSRPAGTDAVT